MKMYKDDMKCNVDKSQVEAMKAGGWTRQASEVKEVEETPEVVEEKVEETPEEETPEVEETPEKPKKETSLKTAPRVVKKRKPIAKKKAGEE